MLGGAGRETEDGRDGLAHSGLFWSVGRGGLRGLHVLLASGWRIVRVLGWGCVLGGLGPCFWCP